MARMALASSSLPLSVQEAITSVCFSSIPIPGTEAEEAVPSQTSAHAR